MALKGIITNLLNIALESLPFPILGIVFALNTNFTYGSKSNFGCPFCSASIVSPVTIFLNSAASVINSSDISSPIFASFPNSITVENLSFNFFKSKTEIFFFPNIVFIKFKYVLLPFEPVPVKINAFPNSFLLYIQYPINSSNNALISLSSHAKLFKTSSVN